MIVGFLLMSVGQYPLHCPLGKWSENIDMGGEQVTVCNTCPKGRYIESRKTCRVCRVGQYQLQQGQISCINCAQGKRSNGVCLIIDLFVASFTMFDSANRIADEVSVHSSANAFNCKPYAICYH